MLSFAFAADILVLVLVLDLAIFSAYHTISPGGIVIHNNWQYTAARAAAVDFRRRLGIEMNHPIHLIDMGSAYWVV